MTALPQRLLALVALAVGGCSADFHPPRLGDTACLDTQVVDFHIEMWRAVEICGTPLPDLTGDYYLQQYAAAWNISYRINPVLDAQIKRRHWKELIQLGSMIPDAYDITSAELR